MSFAPYSRVTRRDFLRNAAFGTMGAALLSPNHADAQNEKTSRYAPFKMGMQSYSLRAFKVDDALAKTQKLGLSYWEAYPDHFPLTNDPKVLDDYKAKLKAHNIELLTYGVVDFGNDEKDARSKFEFAKAMGIRTLSAYPQPDALGLLDRLVEEYQINIAIHNHGPGDNLYAKVQQGVDAIKGHSPRIGACIDTGHYLRIDESPLAAAFKFGKRVYGIHLKDVKLGANGAHDFTELGDPNGMLNTVGLLRILKGNGYDGILSLEYEEHENDPLPYIEKCLAATREAIKKVR